MSLLTANRRALSSVCRLSSSSSSSHCSRLIHSSSSHRAAVLSPSGLVVEEEGVEEISLQPIFDIFDAPTRLSESGEFIRGKYNKAPAKQTVAASYSHAQTTSTTLTSGAALRPRSIPTPLPAPIMFDGPARPKNEAFAFQRRMRDAGLASSSSRTVRSPSQTPPSTRAFSSIEPSVQLFDGPARITRYHHQSASDKERGSSSSKYIVALGVAGTVGCATLLADNENSQSGR